MKEKEEMISWGTSLIPKPNKHTENGTDIMVQHASNDKPNES